jgi:hypothetical protein
MFVNRHFIVFAIGEDNSVICLATVADAYWNSSSSMGPRHDITLAPRDAKLVQACVELIQLFVVHCLEF